MNRADDDEYIKKNKDETKTKATKEAKELNEIAEHFSNGDIIEIINHNYQLRKGKVEAL